MTEGTEERSILIAEERLERVTEAIALASTGAFDEAVTHITAMDHDTFGIVEEALRMFLGELREARRQSEQAIGALQSAKLDLTQKLDTIAQQEAAIHELSTPIIELWDDILTLPVIGLVDANRAMSMTETLLRRVVTSRARWVLIDLTGVAEVGEETADHLLRLSQAVRLIGCQCILTGIGPHVAMTLVNRSNELRDLRSMRTLRDGLRYCLAERMKSHE